MANIEVRDAPDKYRYEAVVDGQVAGFSQYRLSDGLITFTHTEVDDAYEGQGVGSVLVRGALDDVRGQGDRRVRPVCEFVKGYIDRHEEYADLLESRSAAG
jgi:uncharacterized protein